MVDSSALIAILKREPEADDFLKALYDADICLLSSVTWLDTSIVLAARDGGVDSWTMLDRLIADAGVRIVAQDASLADGARRAFVRFGKGRHPAALNICDCASYALARFHDSPLLYKGGDFSQTDIAAAV